ncbi:hypothetical protein EGP95_04065 [bacterium]|nr:hypothetical protein [bacterium]
MKKIKKVYVYLVNKEVEDCLYVYDKGIKRMYKKECKNITLSQIVKEINVQNYDGPQSLAELVKNKVIFMFKTKEKYDSYIFKEIALANYKKEDVMTFCAVGTNLGLSLANYLKSFSANSRFTGLSDYRFLINLEFLLIIEILTKASSWNSKQLNKPYFKYKILCALCVCSTLATGFNSSVGFDNVPNYIKAYSKDLEDLIDDNLSLEEQKEAKEQIIFDSIQSLNQLTDEEKEYMLLLEEYIKDNPYIDLDDVYKKLTTVNVTECSATDKDFYLVADDNTAACNILPTNHIIYFDDNNTDFKKESFVHEYYHSIGNFGFAPRYKHLNEGFTEYLTFETLTDEEFTGSYNKERLCVRYVMALIGKEKILEAYSKKNASILDEALENVLGTMEKVHRFENLINSYCEDEIGINEFLGFIYDNTTFEYWEKVQNESIMDITIREYNFMHTRKLK